MTDKIPDQQPKADRPDAIRPSTSKKPRGNAVEPAQGHIDTQTRYRDRPTDDGKDGTGGPGSG